MDGGVIARVRRNFSRNSDVMEICRALEWRLAKEERTRVRVEAMRHRAKERKWRGVDIPEKEELPG